MTGQPDNAAPAVQPARVCPAGECDGYGSAWADPHVCTCGTGPGGYYGMHERGCGSEPCPAGCEYVDRSGADR